MRGPGLRCVVHSTLSRVSPARTAPLHAIAAAPLVACSVGDSPGRGDGELVLFLALFIVSLVITLVMHRLMVRRTAREPSTLRIPFSAHILGSVGSAALRRPTKAAEHSCASSRRMAHPSGHSSLSNIPDGDEQDCCQGRFPARKL